MRGEHSHIAMEDDPNADVAEQGRPNPSGDRDDPHIAERAREHGQSGGERGKHLRMEDRQGPEEDRQSER